MSENQVIVWESREVGVLLALVGGFLESYTYLLHGGVFANAQTGNMVLLTLSLAHQEWGQVFYYLVPILSFFIGAAVTEVLKLQKRWHEAVIGVEIVLLFFIGFYPLTAPSLMVNLVISFICSMQVSTFRKIQGAAYATTFCTGNLRSAAQSWMDYYLFNGAGEALNKNAKENQNSDVYKKLFAPDTAAISLLNILNNPNKVGTRVQESADETVCTVTFDFYEDNSTVSVQMIRPYGADGIWVPAFLKDLSDAHFIAQKQAEIAENREGGNLVYDHSLKINILPLTPNIE